MEPNDILLPNTLVSQVDVARILRELNTLQDFFVSAAARKSGFSTQPPRLTRLLNKLAEDNHYNLLEEKSRTELYSKLSGVLQNAPLMHISFASEPSIKALEVILVWLRDNIHPHVLLQVGLQPAIAAGCILRTQNKIFDLSMRSYLGRQEKYLVELIAGAARG